MTEMHARHDCEWIDERLEAYLDGELPVAEADCVAAHLADCAGCRRSLALAQRIRESLRASVQPSCPGRVDDELDRLPARPRPGWRPITLAGGIAATLLAVAVMWQQQPERPQQPSARELAQARQDLNVALGYIAQAGRIAGRDVGSVVTRNAVMDPIRDGMHIELKLPVPEKARTDEMES